MGPMRPFSIAATVFGLISITNSASSHEFWLEPHAFKVAPGEEIQADIRVGQDFKGNTYPYIPSRFQSFKRHDAAGTGDVEGTAGDEPALSQTASTPGLSIYTYVSQAQKITFRDWEKFASYLDYEGLKTIPALHEARGLPRDKIVELYTRCAKTLVSIGDEATGQDRATGMKLELVADQNPYRLAAGDEISFTLLWEGKPLADTQVALFERSADGATRSLTRTDAEGKASFKLPAQGPYLIASVHMVESSAEQKANENADWQSYWASLTFELQ